ncbi:hypothetical protein ACIRPR_33745 [Streptomyces griseoflavus]|uniref:hypothetical protein n=1 Tax=Streptomyces griseoflavus TaxID=35619 RepID=UPI0037FCC52E
MNAGTRPSGASVLTIAVSRDGGRTYGPPSTLAAPHAWPPDPDTGWPPCRCPRHRAPSSQPDMDEALRRARAVPVPRLPEPEPAHDWAEDLAHERLVDTTLAHLHAAEGAALAAEEATVRLGYAQLVRDLTAGPEGGRGA